MNSVGAIMTHIAGNQLSRWTDFLSTDGEKPWRDREGEFRPDPIPRDDLLERWEEGWRTLFEALGEIGAEDLLRPITVRGDVHTVIAAVERQLGHYAYHLGQMVTTARHQLIALRSRQDQKNLLKKSLKANNAFFVQ